MPERAPYGTWKSPFDAEMLARAGVRLGEVRASGRDLYWTEMRPGNAGRSTLVRRRADAAASEDVTPSEWNVRTLVHEYGGAAWTVGGDAVFCANFDDQRLYRLEAGSERVLTPDPASPRALRYADLDLSPDGRWLLAVRETHREGAEPRNEVVSIASDGSSEPRVLATGFDFCAWPRFAPDGRRICWVQWDHPNMPWDGTTLWVADFGVEGGVAGARCIAGGVRESIYQPGWRGEDLVFVSDRSGYWNLYAWRDDATRPLAPRAAEFGRPLWGLGSRTWQALPDGRLFCTWIREGSEQVGVLDDTSLEPLALPFSSFGSPSALADGRVALVAGSASQPPCVAIVDPADGSHQVVSRSRETPDPDTISIPRAIRFSGSGGRTAHAWYYPPHSADLTGPVGERPPLLVFSHGGPTGAAPRALALPIQFWTSRGFAVVDVDYSGSTGYGRAYRERLQGSWGIVDVEDCVAAARHLADAGEVDPERLAIRGGSAGGFTTLCALTFHDVFAAGASHYGVADAEILARDTHKFESRYMDGLIGPLPEALETYRARSPIHHTDRLKRPLLLLQGSEDAIVPPDQSLRMAAALDAARIPHALLLFEGEQHGFRRAESIVRAHEAELYFYARIFGFADAAEVAPSEPVAIKHLAQA